MGCQRLPRLSVSFMLRDLRSHTGADNIPSRLASLVADELAHAAHSEALGTFNVLSYRQTQIDMHWLALANSA